jgi:soluble lytic murein transglycosylase-like protein
VRIRHIGILIALALLAIAVLATPASAGRPPLKQLKSQLRDSKQERQKVRLRLRVATADLAGARELYAATHTGATGAELPDPAASTAAPPPGMDQALAAGLLADGVVTGEEIAALEARVTMLRSLAKRWTGKIAGLAKRIHRIEQIAQWNRRGDWKHLIDVAAREYGVSEAGLYRLMILESGGRRTVVSGPYHGLYQFMHREWSESWNKWRDQSIYDGWAQIQLAALAISRGMGPSIWTNTYRMAF